MVNLRNFAKSSLLTACVLLALTVLSGTSASATLIDSFNDGEGIVQQLGIGATTGVQVGTEILGGQREITVDVTASGSPVLGARAVVTNGFLSVSNDSGVASTTTVLWNGGGSLGGVDLTAGGLNIALIISVLENDLSSTISVSILDSNSVWSTVVAGVAPNTVNGVLNFAFGDFTNDLTSVNAVKLVVSGPANLDIKLDFVDGSQVPEPATLLLSAGALLALGLMRRRRA